MDYRLEGAPLTDLRSADLISEGMNIGSIQVPADGQPIVMMADCATTGGYPKIASVIRADLPLLAQGTPGNNLSDLEKQPLKRPRKSIAS